MSRIQISDVSDELELVITAQQLREIREWTLQEDGIERFTYLYCEEVDGRLLTRTVDPVPADQCEVQEAHAVRPSLEVERERLGEAMEGGLVPIMVHSHPFSDVPSFSGLDDEIMEAYREWIGNLYPEIPLGFAVVGHEGIDTAVYVDPDDDRRARLGVDVVGEWKLEQSLEMPDRETATAIDRDRYDRSIRALTADGQQSIAETRVAVVGLGGLGSMTAVQLARFGVEDFLFVDPDVVERSNLPRIYGATEADIDRHKVDVVGEHVVRANPDATVEAYRGRVQDVPEETLATCDVIIGAVDRLTARQYCNEFAVRYLRYYIDGGVAIETADNGSVTDERGLIQLVAPGVSGCLDCLGRNDPQQLQVEQSSEAEIEADLERGYIDEDVVAPEPAVTPLNGMAASSITRLFTKVVTGYAAPPDYLRLDGLNDELVAVSTHTSDDCLTCNADALLARGPFEFDDDLLVSEPSDSLDTEAISDHVADDNEISSHLIASEHRHSPSEPTGAQPAYPQLDVEAAPGAVSWGDGNGTVADATPGEELTGNASDGQPDVDGPSSAVANRAATERPAPAEAPDAGAGTSSLKEDSVAQPLDADRAADQAQTSEQEESGQSERSVPGFGRRLLRSKRGILGLALVFLCLLGVKWVRERS
ncbi:ThiF family adenylyltransferase [Halorubrum ezzemoulense]|uniref:ThiF family adenylyltransferase n=1 Tax=Halorubrum ezzemoulense TaxID=337243 RepID=UPI00232CF476|nr:ThiF family adenylyltransferase [Halorubrum ezzemoulense]MDB9234982.1 ThiF family adenylyltransferase [Halorubrum ezzemoulense]MDB9250786.1 ThiF family adenylyltransferase [Halorubrum ezzemoulense]MDB9260902.1 ThiF family adenylyltransferase [Halorubrum ezzemoulense]MDB9264337.1 ThiF family adenylyltransferase [Halorubrum ezzemoulense]MDB9267807.1 ThiF family adenylyltransferase [Halorubrum ezzemoulense]